MHAVTVPLLLPLLLPPVHYVNALFGRRTQGHDLSMRAAGFLGVTKSQEGSVTPRNHTPYSGVGVRQCQCFKGALLRQAPRMMSLRCCCRDGWFRNHEPLKQSCKVVPEALPVIALVPF